MRKCTIPHEDIRQSALVPAHVAVEQAKERRRAADAAAATDD